MSILLSFLATSSTLGFYFYFYSTFFSFPFPFSFSSFSFFRSFFLSFFLSFFSFFPFFPLSSFGSTLFDFFFFFYLDLSLSLSLDSDFSFSTSASEFTDSFSDSLRRCLISETKNPAEKSQKERATKTSIKRDFSEERITSSELKNFRNNPIRSLTPP